MKTELVTTILYSELEKIVSKAYNLPKGRDSYSFVATELCGNDSIHRFDVTKIEPLEKWEQKGIGIPLGNHDYSNSAIMQDLVNKGILERGIYLVEVSW